MAFYSLRCDFTVPASAGQYAPEIYPLILPGTFYQGRVSSTPLTVISSVAGVTLESWMPTVPNPASVSDFVLGTQANGPSAVRVKSGGTGGTYSALFSYADDVNANLSSGQGAWLREPWHKVDFTVPATINNYAPEEVIVPPTSFVHHKVDIATVAGAVFETWVAVPRSSWPPAAGDYVYHSGITTQEGLLQPNWWHKIRLKSGGTSGTATSMFCEIGSNYGHDNVYHNNNNRTGGALASETVTAAVPVTLGNYAPEEYEFTGYESLTSLALVIESLPASAEVEIYLKDSGDAGGYRLYATKTATGGTTTILRGRHLKIRVKSGGTSGSCVFHVGLI